jgi:hypothetical protein
VTNGCCLLCQCTEAPLRIKEYPEVDRLFGVSAAKLEREYLEYIRLCKVKSIKHIVLNEGTLNEEKSSGMIVRVDIEE